MFYNIDFCKCMFILKLMASIRLGSCGMLKNTCLDHSTGSVVTGDIMIEYKQGSVIHKQGCLPHCETRLYKEYMGSEILYRTIV